MHHGSRGVVSATREETKRAGEALGVGLVLGVLHLAVLSDRFSTVLGRGGLTFLGGCTFITGILWAMLALRSLAADKPAGPEIDDGLTSMAVMAWVVALVPPRASNFLLETPVDDFTRAYLPVSLSVVFVVLFAQALWPRREEKQVWLRFFSSLAVSLWLLAGFVLFIARGADAAAVAVRALGLGTLAALGAGVQWWRTRV